MKQESLFEEPAPAPAPGKRRRGPRVETVTVARGARGKFVKVAGVVAEALDGSRGTLDGHVRPSRARAQFEAFHASNPRVWELLVRYALQAKGLGRTKIGIDVLYGRIRWDLTIATDGDPAFKLNNNHRPFYARKLMIEVPELRGLFEIRRAIADDLSGDVLVDGDELDGDDPELES